MSRTEKFIFSALCVIAFVLIGAVINTIRIKWLQPLGPSLQSTGNEPTVFEKIYQSVSIPLGINPPLPTPELVSVTSTLMPVETAVTTPVGPGVCGGTTPMFILLIGSDTRADGYTYGLADVIRIVRVDFHKPQIVVLEYPRDLWVEIPDIADNLNGQNFEKLNQAYLYGNKGFGYTDDPAGGPGLLSRTLTLNFGTQIDQYVAVNMNTFEKIVNAVDGIDVTLPKTVDGRTDEDRGDHLLFPQGTHHLNGQQALTLARVRISGVFSRAENQNRVLCALRDKLTSPEVVSDIPELVQAFQGSVQTSLSPEQISQLACLSTKVDPRSILLTSFPQELFTQSRIYDPSFKKDLFIWDVDFEVLRDYTSRFNSGEWPSPITAVSASQPPPPASAPAQKQETLFCE